MQTVSRLPYVGLLELLSLSLIRTVHLRPLSSIETQNVGILIQNTCKCLLSKQCNGNIVNKAVKDTRLE